MREGERERRVRHSWRRRVGVRVGVRVRVRVKVRVKVRVRVRVRVRMRVRMRVRVKARVKARVRVRVWRDSTVFRSSSTRDKEPAFAREEGYKNKIFKLLLFLIG